MGKEEVDLSLVRARGKVLAREGRNMRANLVKVRRSKGLTQQDVADRMGITQQAVYKLERYDADPKLSTLERYANAVEAIVEHHVQADNGQSARLAAQSRWISSYRITASRGQGLSDNNFLGWSGSTVREVEILAHA